MAKSAQSPFKLCNGRRVNVFGKETLRNPELLVACQVVALATCLILLAVDRAWLHFQKRTCFKFMPFIIGTRSIVKTRDRPTHLQADRRS